MYWKDNNLIKECLLLRRVLAYIALVGGVVSGPDVGLWPAHFDSPVPDPWLTGDRYMDKLGLPTQPFISPGSVTE